MVETADVVIIGGGPAGLAAAIVLGREGIRTHLYEKKPFPVDKPCGEGVLPNGVAYLQQLGLSGAFAPEVRFPLAGVRFLTATGTLATAPFAEGPGLGIRRTVLSAALLRCAQQYEPVHIFAGQEATPEAVADGHVVVRSGRRRTKARLLIGADGAGSRVRRWAGLREGRPRYQRWGARRHFCLEPWSEYVEVYWSRQGVEAYITPIGREEVGVAFLWDKTRYGMVRGGKELFDSLLQAFPALARRLQGAAATSDVAAVGPLQRPVQRATGDGMLLMGDAAGYLDAITGEGISLSLAQALALPETVVPFLRQGYGMLGREALLGYASACRAIVRPYYHFTHLLLFFSRHPRLLEAVVPVLAERPALFQRLLSASMGFVPPWQLKVWAALLPRAGRHFFRNAFA